MEIKTEHIDELIAKYLSGEALPEEAIELEEWKEASAANRSYFDECEKTFAFIERRKVSGETDTQLLFNRIMEQAEVPPKKGRVLHMNHRSHILKVAAILLICSVLGTSVAYMLMNNHDETLASGEQSMEKRLADDSRIFLNRHSSITIDRGFNKKERRVRLEGEAFFEVKHEEGKPFIVEAGGIEVKDIGTAFNIKAEKKGDSIFVFVKEGVVEVSHEGSTVTLREGQSAVYIRPLQVLKLTREEASENVISYKTKVFHFKAAALGEVIKKLNEVYGNIILLKDEKAASCLITVDFNNELPETIVAVMSETLGLSYQKTNGKYEIEGSACNP